ncbi:MAG: adenine deaminase [Syntrophotaleaceae bacterium]
MEKRELLAVARGARPGDLVLRNLRLVDVLAKEIYPTEIVLCGDTIAGIGKGYRGKHEIDLGGRLVCPGLIDAHVHIESSLVRPREYARAVVARGVTTVIANPHEIANVLGLEGVLYMARDGREGPLDILLTVPSSVPATPLSTSGSALKPADLVRLRKEGQVVGLGEVMDFPAVVKGDERLLDELALFADRIIDGHCPGLDGNDLNAYIAPGIRSDHESTSVDEGREKLRRGMHLFLREGSAARNLQDLLPLVTSATERWICFCTDDLNPQDLLNKGSVDHHVRMAIRGGIDPLTAIRMATLNAAEYFQLFDRGFIGPGRRADLVVLESLENFHPAEVYFGGRLVSCSRALPDHRVGASAETEPKRLRASVKVAVEKLDFSLRVRGNRIRAIHIVPGQLVTEESICRAKIENGLALSDPNRDLLKLAVVERHRGSGRVGLGFVQGLGLHHGALAGTVAHDHHNLIIAGADDRSMLTAARAVVEAQGGLAVAQGDEVKCLLPMPLAGLMSDRTIEEVAAVAARLKKAAAELGSPLDDPFMTLSFLGLEVIPSLKLTDLGLIDVDRMQPVSLFPDE